ncbi:hypothetical protein I317_04004 [Kwoniella heveanensis CBS 569]|nr:hypothetical protein I317_04004 [Kwoniella heveanensis CBS 569]
MGYTIQLQWSYTPPAGRQISLADIVLPRVLEHHGLHTPTRSTIQFRTYRAQFPSGPLSSSSSASTVPDLASSSTPTQPQTHSRYLTSIATLPPPTPPSNNQHQSQTQAAAPPKVDDTAYLFLDDRTPQAPGKKPDNADNENEDEDEDDEGDVPLSKRKEGKGTITHEASMPNGGAVEPAQAGSGGRKDQPMEIDATGVEGQDKAVGGDSTTVEADADADADEDDFEIIDKPETIQSQPADTNHASTSTSAAAPGPTAVENGYNDNAQTSTSRKGKGKESSEGAADKVKVNPKKPHQRFRCIAVRPSHNVGPLLQSLLSPFVMGLTKSARATASTTSSLPTPTPLPGSTLLLTLLTFAPASPPSPPVILRVYILPNPTAGSIFLEAEYAAAGSAAGAGSGPSSSLPFNANGSGNNLDSQGRGDTWDWDDEQRHTGSSMVEVEQALKTFLAGCLVDGLIGGETKWISLNPHPNLIPGTGIAQDGWEGAERSKRSMFALAKTLRESGFI